MTATETRFLTGVRAADESRPGIVMEQDGSIWVVGPTGARTQIGSGVVAGTGDGVTDDTAALQAAIDQAPVGGTVLLPSGTFKTTEALRIDKDITFAGSGTGAAVGGAANSNNGSGPTTAPYLTGSVLMPSTPGQNGIEIVGTGVAANLRDFGIRFADPIMCLDTGHGIHCLSDDIVTVGHDLSLYGSLWQNLKVFGHDGDHYGYYIVNPLMGTFLHLRSFGGGGLYMEGEHDDCRTGNAVIIHPYVWMFAGGTANSYTLKAQRQGLNLIEFHRPQTIVSDVPSELSGQGITSPTIAQYMWRHDGTDVQRISIYDPDLEGPTFLNPVDFGGEGANVIVRPGGIIYGPDPTDVAFATLRLGIDVDTGLTVTPGAGLGAVGAASTPFGARDDGCRVRVVTDGTPGAAGNLICTVTYGFPGPRDTVVLQPTETQGAAEAGFFTYGTYNTTHFDIYALNQLDPNTTYDIQFIARKTYE